MTSRFRRRNPHLAGGERSRLTQRDAILVSGDEVEVPLPFSPLRDLLGSGVAVVGDRVRLEPYQTVWLAEG